MGLMLNTQLISPWVHVTRRLRIQCTILHAAWQHAWSMTWFLTVNICVPLSCRRTHFSILMQLTWYRYLGPGAIKILTKYKYSNNKAIMAVKGSHPHQILILTNHLYPQNTRWCFMQEVIFTKWYIYIYLYIHMYSIAYSSVTTISYLI
jgi:hypothetical protein